MYLRLITASFLPAKLVYSSSNSASTRCCARKFLLTFFFMSLSVCYPHHPWSLFLQPTLLHPHPPHPPPNLLLSVLRFRLCGLSWLCSCLSSCAAILRLQKRRERRGKNKTRNGKHLQKMKNNGFRWPRRGLLSLLLRRHSHTQRQTHTLPHTSPQPRHLSLKFMWAR